MADSVRNPDGYWINTSVFREEANHFAKYGYYCPDPPGSAPWLEYWTEQQKRCLEGYSVAGVKITGDHYKYMNFCPIKLTDTTGTGKVKAADKKTALPYFWDGDYDYFHNINIARYGCTEEELKALQLINNPTTLTGGMHVIVGKARRKGFSYKNAAIVVNRYSNVRNSVSVIGAYDKKYLYPKGTMAMVNDYMEFLNKHTGFARKRDYVDRVDAREASFEGEVNGIKTKMGYQSMVLAISFKDNESAARGKDGTLILFEEAGSFPNLEASYLATKPSLEDGIYVTGQMIVFGTSGGEDMYDFTKMFYNPAPYGAIAFENVWDENAYGNKCSFFFPDYQNKPGFIDENGNSDKEAAKEYEIEKRKIIAATSTTSDALTSHTQEFCFSPEEAFLQAGDSMFPIMELRARLNKVISNNLHIKKGQPVHLTREDGVVKAIPDLTGQLKPIWDWKPKPDKSGVIDKTGAVVIYFYPEAGAMPGRYIGGYDPVQQEQGTSFASIWIFDTLKSRICAEYYGRPGDSDAPHRTAELLAELYHAEIMHENMTMDVKTYFRNKKKLHLLAAQPDNVINANIKESTVKRILGVHMTDALFAGGLKYLVKFITEERDFDEDGTKILNLDEIYSPGFLEEMIGYRHKQGNYDRMSAFFMVLFFREEEALGMNNRASEYNEKIKQELESLRTVRQFGRVLGIINNS